MTNITLERLYLDDPKARQQTKEHHLSRYKFAIKHGVKGLSLDLACGSGYGTDMMRKNGFDPLGIDISNEAIDYASKNFPNTKYTCANLNNVVVVGTVKTITFFEAIEHISFEDGLTLLKKIVTWLDDDGILFLSTPRDAKEKYNKFHKSEWGYDLLKNTLGSLFTDIKILGQDWNTGKISSKNVIDNDFYLLVCKKGKK